MERKASNEIGGKKVFIDTYVKIQLTTDSSRRPGELQQQLDSEMRRFDS
jgi:hypothetical protein